MALATGRVAYQIGKLVADGVDPDDLPDLVKLSGYVQFIPEQPQRVDPGTGAQVVVGNFQAGIDSDGVMRDSQSNPYVTLPTGSWYAHIRLLDSPITVGPYLIVIQEGQTTNLALAAPATSTGKLLVLTGPPGPPGPTGPQGPAGAGQVASVNGETGTVVLTPADVGAQPAGNYVTTPTMTSAIAAVTDSLAPVATSGDFADLTGASSAAILDTIKADLLALIGAVSVFHGSNANFARPVLPAGVRVVWYGSVTPNNMVSTDVHTSTTGGGSVGGGDTGSGTGDTTLSARVTTIEGILPNKADLAANGKLVPAQVPNVTNLVLVDSATSQTGKLGYDSASGRFRKVP